MRLSPLAALRRDREQLRRDELTTQASQEVRCQTSTEQDKSNLDTLHRVRFVELVMCMSNAYAPRPLSFMS